MADHLRLIHSATVSPARTAGERKGVGSLRALIVREKAKASLRELSSLAHELRCGGMYADAELLAEHHDILADWLGQLLEEMTE